MDKTKVGLVFVLLGAAGAGYYFISYKPKKAPEPIVLPTKPQPEMPKPQPMPAVSLEDSDDVVRERAKNLSSNPKFGQWLKNESIIRRITAAASIISDGNSPRDSLGFLAPRKPFSILRKGGKIYLNPKGYDRYNAIGEVFESLDATGAANLFKDLKPLFQKAYDELGSANADVQDVLVRGISTLLETPVVVGNIRLKPRVVSYAIVDPKLEKLNAAQKHLLRMGPENATKIQNKLREIALDLGTQDAQLPKPQTYSSPVR